jgi:enoyl-CoA hydratase/carnithine racemase
MNRDLLEKLNGALKKAAASNPTCIGDAKADSDHHPVRVVILQSHGYVFSSGHDLKEISKLVSQSDKGKARSDVKELFDLCSDTMQLLQSIPQPTICAVEGLATAAGCQLVASCDMAVASSLASFQTPGVTIGLFCHTPAVPLVRCIGTKQAMDMLLTGRALSANEALTHGLVSRLAKDAQKEARKVAVVLATERSAATLKMGKEIFHQQVAERCVEDAYAIASRAMVDNLELYDATHGIDAFLNKTNPDFLDR